MSVDERAAQHNGHTDDPDVLNSIYPAEEEKSHELPDPNQALAVLGIDARHRTDEGRTVVAPDSLRLADGRSRNFRLAVAVTGIVGLFALWLAMAFLRDAALHRVPPLISGTGLLQAPLHARPSYFWLFLLLSYAAVVAGIAFSTGMHDPYSAQLRIARRRVVQATSEYDCAFQQRVLDSLEVEQSHRDMFHLAPKRVDIVRARSGQGGR